MLLHLVQNKNPPKHWWNLERTRLTQLLAEQQKKRLHSKDFAELGNALEKIPTIMFLCASECINLYSGPWRDLYCVPYLASAIFGPWSILLENLHSLWETGLPKEQMPPGSMMSGVFRATLVLLRTAICCKYCKSGCLQIPQELKWPPGMKTQDWGTSLLQHT